MIDQAQLIQFLCEAKQHTYKVGNNRVIGSRPNAQDSLYEREDLKYIDTCLGEQQIVGEEAIWQDNKPIWGMNYTGRVVGEGYDASFLVEALRRVKEDLPYRGPRFLELGEYTYKCRVEGEFDWFVGCEKILYKGVKVYEAMFQGGIIR
ncbi:MAG: hypothetical protein E7231_07045 [Cellulosilyticum sp.]|nr:hypothetical protein [Cellulosilyticum sp.]